MTSPLGSDAEIPLANGSPSTSRDYDFSFTLFDGGQLTRRLDVTYDDGWKTVVGERQPEMPVSPADALVAEGQGGIAEPARYAADPT